MKKIGWGMIFFGVCIVVASAAFYFIARLNAYEEYFIKSRLTAILEGEGKIVEWSKGRYDDLPLILRKGIEGEGVRVEPREWEPPRKSIDALLVHFIETERGVVILDECLPFSTPGVMMRPELFHNHGRDFQIFSFMKFENLRSDFQKLEKTFPYEEIKSIRKWQGEVAGKGFLYGGASGAAMVALGIIALTLHFFRTHKIPPVIIAEEHTVFGVIAPRQKDALVSEISSETKKAVERKEDTPLLIKEVESMIARSEGDMRAALEKILAELPNTRGRIKKTRYLMEKARVIFLLKESPLVEEAEEKVSPPPSPQEERTIEEVLTIEDFIPKEFNPRFIKLILLWGFLRPTEVKKFFGEHYRPYEHIRRDTVGKGVPPEEFEDSFEWLLKVGVIKRVKGGVKNLLYSLNPDSGSAASPGSDIIRVIIRAAQYLEGMKRH